MKEIAYRRLGRWVGLTAAVAMAATGVLAGTLSITYSSAHGTYRADDGYGLAVKDNRLAWTGFQRPPYAGGQPDNHAVFLFGPGLTTTDYAFTFDPNNSAQGWRIAFDKDTNLWVAGRSYATDSPVTAGAYQSAKSSGWDGHLMKLDPTQSGTASILYATYLGGSGSDDTLCGVAVDKNGNVYVAGYANSTDLPTTANAYRRTKAGGYDGFFAKFDANGVAQFVSYLGGANDDLIRGIDVDADGNIYMVMTTRSPGLPAVNAYDGTYAALTDLYLVKFDPTGTNILYSSYLGGTGYEAWFNGGIAVRNAHNVYICGNSSGGSPTKNAWDSTLNGNHDAYFARFDTTLSGEASLLAASYYGGSAGDFLSNIGIKLDRFGNVYLVGSTTSDNLPLKGACQTARGGGSDAFVAVFSPDCSKLLTATYLGGSGEDLGQAVAVDDDGNIYLTGRTASWNFPMTPDAAKPSVDVTFKDSFITKLSVDPDGDPAVAADRYWEWGWGNYGSGIFHASPLDSARYDWTYLLFGNEPCDQRIVNRCNEILRLNPRHKFVVRTWAASGGTGFMQYLYQPGYWDTLLQTIWEQIETVANGLSRPENLVGATFQEELPDHFSSGMAQDVAQYPQEIAAELGAPFDADNPAHRAWYGQKWAQVQNEINLTMRSALNTLNGAAVIYYQGTMFCNLDDYDAWLALGTGPYWNPDPSTLIETNFLPFHYGDIVMPGYCDGIFGYPRVAWDVRTTEMVEKLDCLMFSQTSLPPGMRSFSLANTLSLACWEDSRNLGTFLYPSQGYKVTGYGVRDLDYQDAETYWTITDHMRQLGWDYEIGMDIVNSNMIPNVELDYRLENLVQGQIFALHALVHNPRHPSWYGGEIPPTQMKQVNATLTVPSGFSIPPELNPGSTIALGDMEAGEYRSTNWVVRLDACTPVIPNDQAFRVAVTTKNADGTTAASGEEASASMNQRIPSLVTHPVERSGVFWAESSFRSPTQPVIVEVQALYENIVHPQLTLNTGGSVLYNDTLRPSTLLRFGPGSTATLKVPYIDEKTRHFGSDDPYSLTAFAGGYPSYSVRISALSGDSYKVSLTGRAEGGNVMVCVLFSGYRNGVWATDDFGSRIYGGLTTDPNTVNTVQSGDFTAPQFDGGVAYLTIRFYRIGAVGTLYLQSFNCIQVGVPETGIDVSDKIVGSLPALTSPFTVWTYQDESDPVANQLYKAAVTFVGIPPVTQISSPANNAVVTGPIAVQATVTSDAAIEKVAFFDGETPIGVDYTAPYCVSWNPSLGAHALTAVATDGAGQEGVSETVNVTRQ
ncbi:MAG: SBBP repeat-containing protein [Kiritimatiellae bacterium]|nr:SBBP repeat-containing protein [Kiritimatiellia bacterium]